MAHNFEAIIFDMDGTLVDSEPAWEVAEGEMFEERGLSYNDEVRQAVIGLRLDEFFEKLIELYNIEGTVAELVAELTERMGKVIPEIVKPKPGAQEILEYVAEQKIPYCIASSSPLAIIDIAVQSQGWLDLIPQRYTADAVPLGKPAPDVYLYAAEKLGVNPANCLALEDSPAGSKSAVAAGMTCYTVPDYHSKHVDFSSITPHVFEDLHAVLAHLKG